MRKVPKNALKSARQPSRRRLLGWGVAAPLLTLGLRAAAQGAPVLPISVTQVLQQLDIRSWQPGSSIDLTLPDMAEDGARVAVEVSAALAGVRRIVLLAEGNPFPLLADVRFDHDALPWLELRIKLAASTHVAAFAEVSGQWYQARRFVNVIAGGCGQA